MSALVKLWLFELHGLGLKTLLKRAPYAVRTRLLVPQLILYMVLREAWGVLRQGGCRVQVYLGKWHSSEVAIKCLNPSLFFSGSDGSASKAAMADLLREADLLASLRHPNVVWVYGVVLPRMVSALLHAPRCSACACMRPVAAQPFQLGHTTIVLSRKPFRL